MPLAQARRRYRMQQLMSAVGGAVDLDRAADHRRRQLNRELNTLFDPPSDPNLLKGKRIAICCTNGGGGRDRRSIPLADRARATMAHRLAAHRRLPPHARPALSAAVRNARARDPRLMENAGWLKIDRYTDEATASDYDAILPPGGAGTRTRCAPTGRPRWCARWTRAGKPTRAICHGQWVMISAEDPERPEARPRWNIQIDVENAGATVLDEPCVVDGNLITARSFRTTCRGWIEAMVGAAEAGGVA